MKNKEPPGITTLWDEGAGGFLHAGKLLVMARNVYCKIHEGFTIDINGNSSL